MPSLSPINYDSYSSKRKPKGLDFTTFEQILDSDQFEQTSGQKYQQSQLAYYKAAIPSPRESESVQVKK